MKISELEALLRQYRERHGDLPVYVEDEHVSAALETGDLTVLEATTELQDLPRRLEITGPL